jgi:molybdopterin-guanine dinucleotide biosynthesis protein A
MNSSIDAVILGGGTLKGLDDAVDTADAGRGSKALLDINGREMIEYIIEALKQSPSIGRIVVVAPAEAVVESWSSKVETIIPAGDNIIENGVAALNYLKETTQGLTDRVIFMTCDTPLITSGAIEDYILRCSDPDGAIFYPIISKEVIEAKYPETKRTYATLKDGIYTGGNLAVVNPEILLANLDLLQKVFELRKSVPKLMMFLGPGFIIKLGLKTLSVPDIEKRATEMMNAKTVAVITPYPEIGIDVDKPSDLELVKQVMG